MKKFIILIMTCLMAFTSLFVGACSNEKTGDGSPATLFNRGIHVRDYVETEDYWVKDGATDYKLLISYENKDAKYIKYAVEDFQNLFFEATGITIPVVYDNEVYLAADSTFISIGKNRIFDETGISTEEYNLDKHGFVIKTFFKSIFIAGNTDISAMYGMYEFLDYELNFDCFSNTSYYIDTEVTDLKFKNYNVTEVPDIKNRAAGDSFIINHYLTTRRMRYNGRDEESFLGSSSAHTYFYHIPKETYLDPAKPSTYHPEWYSTDQTQLCFTAKGDEESRQLLLEAALNSFKYEVSINNEGYMFIFSSEDNGAWCSCNDCKAISDQYNSNAAVVIQFLNELSDMIKDWFADDSAEGGAQYAREFYILFLGYQHTEVPPVDYNSSTGTYIPKDASVICDDNVSVMFAAGSYDYQNSINHQVNLAFIENFKGWSAISKRFNVYRYKSNFRDFMIPYDTFSWQQEFYQLIASYDCYWAFDEGQRSHTAGATGWQVLKSYLVAKICWDVNADVNELTDRYFDKYFGPASASMRKWFDEYRVHSTDLIENHGWTRTNSIYHTACQAKYWPKQLLDRWYGYINDAIDDINYLKKVDPVKYQEYYDHIVMERISIYYMMYQLYGKGTRYSQEFINDILVQYDADCKRLGVSSSIATN